MGLSSLSPISIRFFKWSHVSPPWLSYPQSLGLQTQQIAYTTDNMRPNKVGTCSEAKPNHVLKTQPREEKTIQPRVGEQKRNRTIADATIGLNPGFPNAFKASTEIINGLDLELWLDVSEKTMSFLASQSDHVITAKKHASQQCFSKLEQLFW